MVKVLFDTNILIDYFKRHEAAEAELNRFKNQAISLITWVEVMGR